MPAFHSNIWNDFFESYGNDLRRPDSDSWLRFTARSSRPDCWLVRFFALAWYESNKGQPLVCRQDDAITCVSNVSQREFEFKYSDFTNNKTKLRDQLRSFGVDLLRADDGDYQYLRTIHRLSGAVYLKAARRAASISPDNWISAGQLASAIVDEIRKYANAGERDDGDNGLIADGRDFFAFLQKQYWRCNELPDRLAFLHGARRQFPLSDRMLDRILAEVKPRERGIDVETIDETRPVFRFDESDRVVLGFPPGRHPRFNVADNICTVQFVFNPDSEDCRVIRFRRNGDGWTQDKAFGGVTLDEIDRVVRKCFDAEGTPIGTIVDVMPTALSDPGAGFILFRKNANGSAHEVPSFESLSNGIRHFVVWLRGCTPKSVAWTPDEDPSGGAWWNELTIGANGGFTLPPNAGRIRIGETEYDAVSRADEFLDRSAAFGRDPAGGKIVNSGSRLFFEQRSFPYSDTLLENETIGVRYQKSDGTTVSFPDGSLRQIPPDLFWNRGRIEFFGLENDETICSRAVTFLPDINDAGLNSPFDLDTASPATVSAGNDVRSVVIPPVADGKVQNHVEFDWHGFRFRYPIRRRGLLVQIRDSGDLPAPIRAGGEIVLAKDDFDAAVFVAELPDAAVPLSVERENGAVAILEKKKFQRQDIASISCGDDFGTWCFRNGAETLGSVRVYRPDQTPWNAVSGHPVFRDRDGSDLVVRFWIARRWRGQPLSLVYIPAHKQDEGAKSVPATDVSFENANGMLRADLHFGGFYGNEHVDWGAGLLCFVAFPRGNAKWQAVSSGFFLPRPDDARDTWPPSTDQDPYGLRKAMAECDLPKINEIMSSDDNGCRGYIRDFEQKAYRALYSLGGDNMKYFHAYRSRCKQEDGSFEPSGYFFMAGWFVQEKTDLTPLKVNIARQNGGNGVTVHVVRMKMEENYRGMWSPLLRPFSPNDIRQGKQMASLWLEATNNAVRNGVHVWTDAHSFNDRDVGDAALELVSVIEKTKKGFRRFLDAKALRYDPARDDLSFLSDDTPIGHEGGKTGTSLEKCLSRLAKWTVEWRSSPDIRNVQELRELLLRVERLDSRLAQFWDRMDEDPNDGFGSRRRPFSLTDRISMKTWLLS